MNLRFLLRLLFRRINIVIFWTMATRQGERVCYTRNAYYYFNINSNKIINFNINVQIINCDTRNNLLNARRCMERLCYQPQVQNILRPHFLHHETWRILIDVMFTLKPRFRRMHGRWETSRSVWAAHLLSTSHVHRSVSIFEQRVLIYLLTSRWQLNSHMFAVHS